MIIIDELPFRFVEHDGFIRFMIICCPDFRIPCLKTIRSECFKIFLLSKARLKEFFKNSCAGRVSITTDTWTSVQNLNYMCITAHYVGKDWKLHKKIINFTKITSHKGDEGAKLAECLEEWGLKNVFTVTLDNASTNDVACTFLKEKLETWGTSFMSGRYLHVRCVALIVNLVVNGGLNEIGMSVNRVREAMRWVRSSGSREAKFHAQVTAQNEQSKRMVSLDCQTRWNSTFLMLDTALVYERVFTVLDVIDPTFKEALFARKTSSGVPIGAPTTEDWKLMTKTASGTKYCTVHLFLGELTRLYNHLSKASSGFDQHLASVAWNMKAKVEKYWDESEGENVKMNKIVYIALLFDPRHKMHMLEHCFELMYGALRGQQLKILVKEELVKMFEMYRDALTAREGEQVQGSVAVPPMNTEEDEDYDDTFAGYDLQQKEIGNRAELDKYLDDAREGAGDVTEEFDILTWWKVVGAYKYPVMSEIAKDILAIPLSSVASESTFSNGGRVLDDFRSSLLPKIVEALICPEDWLRNPDDNGNDEEDEEDQIQFMECMSFVLLLCSSVVILSILLLFFCRCTSVVLLFFRCRYPLHC
ncbi:Zinc finger BED domain-containing protein RICESLEEPER 2 [Linum perenne]